LLRTLAPCLVRSHGKFPVPPPSNLTGRNSISLLLPHLSHGALPTSPRVLASRLHHGFDLMSARIHGQITPQRQSGCQKGSPAMASTITKYDRLGDSALASNDGKHNFGGGRNFLGRGAGISGGRAAGHPGACPWRSLRMGWFGKEWS
jgi:hypothetical protein